MDEKKRELLKKLYILAERGATDGERAAARERLENLLQKYDIDEAELADDVLEMHWYTCRDANERQLFTQVCYKVNRDRATYRRVHGAGKHTERGVKCTKAEAVQIEIEFDFYKTLWHEELDFFLRAFIQKHHIFDLTPGYETNDTVNKQDLFRMAQMAMGMQDRTLHKMIENVSR